MNSRISRLQPYPFDRLRALLEPVTANASRSHIPLHIGEPKHQPPPWVVDALSESLRTSLGVYPLAKGLPEIRNAAARWLERRFNLSSGRIDPERMVIPVNGTREALFSFCQAVVDLTRQPNALVAMPNPGYQIYEGAALLAGAEPYYLNTDRETDFLPNLESVSPDIWHRCQLLYLCSPGNPTGQVLTDSQWRLALQLADQHDFIIAADECYSELYGQLSGPPLGLLESCERLGRTDFRSCVVFHSLSKRSNVPGLRSGFVAGNPEILSSYLQYRSYHGCAVPNAVQQASAVAWEEEQHVRENRRVYERKFDAVLPILGEQLDLYRPDGGFYLWADVGMDDQVFTKQLFESQNVSVLPGSYMARNTPTGNPGQGMVRICLVAPLEVCIDAAQRIKEFIMSGSG